ncbi:MAG TPA: helix-turn-helix transcriptional regulator [Cryptosporangiaceae bacterium]|nr:helix-turn-helix transcriptional regulator [Cryptosporangiaceae bacterium]
MARAAGHGQTVGMIYQEWRAPPALSSHVACLWARRQGPPRVLPDGCVDLVWTGDELIVAGPATRAVVPRLPSAEPKLGIRFRIGAASPVLGLPAAELLDATATVAEIWAGGQRLTDRVGEAVGAASRLQVMMEAVAAQLEQAAGPDPVVRAAVLGLCRSRTPIAALSNRLGMSDRQLRRRFENAVGYSPRTLGRVLRLQRFLGLVADGGQLARAAVEAGYADQPHLTRDCRQLTGLPPAALVATGAGPAGERLKPA